MAKSCVMIDFFEMERRKMADPSKLTSPECAASAARGIQNVVSRINPQLLKMAMSIVKERSSEENLSLAPTASNPPSPTRIPASRNSWLPVYSTVSRGSYGGPDTDTAPMTIIYHGDVATFDIPRDKASAVMKVAETGLTAPERPPEDSSPYDNHGAQGLPMARRKSLQRFLEKRNERLAAATASPYTVKLKPAPSRRPPQLPTSGGDRVQVLEPTAAAAP